MSVSDFNMLSRFRVGIYSFTIFLVMVAGFILYSSMGLDEPPKEVSMQDLAVQRNVASILPSAIKEPSMSRFAPMVMEIDCSDISARPPVTVNTSHLRLKTKGCKPLSVFNEDNAFQATLFDLGTETYSTDYISLADGENRLVILRDEGDNFPIAISLLVLSQ